MNKKDLENIKSNYELFNVLLFNNSLPRANKINFMLHRLPYAAGFSRHRDKPTKNGNIHDIAFCRYFTFSERQIQEILIHEMIHLWQDSHVSEERYKRCTNDIAHDRVFLSKMSTINVILARKGFDLKISEVCKDKLKLDENVSSSVYHYVFFAEDYGGNHVCFKTKLDKYDDIVNEFKKYCEDEDLHKDFKNVYVIKTKDYRFNLYDCSKKIPEYLKAAEDWNTKKDLYEMFEDEGDWIVKDGNFVK